MMSGQPETGPRGNFALATYETLRAKVWKWVKGRADPLRGSPCCWDEDLQAKPLEMHKEAEEEGPKPKPGPSHPQMTGEDVVLSWWGLLVTNIWAPSSVRNSGRKLAQLLTLLLDAGKQTSTPQSYPSLKKFALLKQLFLEKGKLHHRDLWPCQDYAAWEEKSSFSWFSPLIRETKPYDFGLAHSW